HAVTPPGRRLNALSLPWGGAKYHELAQGPTSPQNGRAGSGRSAGVTLSETPQGRDVLHGPDATVGLSLVQLTPIMWWRLRVTRLRCATTSGSVSSFRRAPSAASCRGAESRCGCAIS